jgi:hypothetical protein
MYTRLSKHVSKEINNARVEREFDRAFLEWNREISFDIGALISRSSYFLFILMARTAKRSTCIVAPDAYL